jgi:DNA-binding MarR family transcriptional regulator
MQEIEDAAKAFVFGNLRKVSRAITQFYDKQLGPSGITIAQLALIRTISIGYSSTFSKISKDMYMDQTTLTRNLGLLKKHDFIMIETSSDKRKRGKAQITN